MLGARWPLTLVLLALGCAGRSRSGESLEGAAGLASGPGGSRAGGGDVGGVGGGGANGAGTGGTLRIDNGGRGDDAAGGTTSPGASGSGSVPEGGGNGGYGRGGLGGYSGELSNVGASAPGGTVGTPFDDLPDTDAACAAYTSASLFEACRTLTACAPTFVEFAALLADAGQLGWYTARKGCGLTELLPPNGTPAALLTFDADGNLAGYFIEEKDRVGPCHDYKYVQGAQIPQNCEEVHFCWVDPNATGRGDICACRCPDPPPADGVVVSGPECVLPEAGGTVICRTSWYDEQQVEVTVEPPFPADPLTFPEFSEGCGLKVASFGSTECVYDNAGGLLGARTTGSNCPGVVSWLTEGTPPPGCPEE